MSFIGLFLNNSDPSNWLIQISIVAFNWNYLKQIFVKFINILKNFKPVFSTQMQTIPVHQNTKVNTSIYAKRHSLFALSTPQIKSNGLSTAPRKTERSTSGFGGSESSAGTSKSSVTRLKMTATLNALKTRSKMPNIAI